MTHYYVLMKLLEKLLLVSVFFTLVGLSLWLQYGILEPAKDFVDSQSRHDPDYYIENFTAVGMDDKGKRKYILEAERLVHYPDDDTALLDNPHLIQYEPGQAPRHTYAESGWFGADGNEILLTGNVRVIQGNSSEAAGGIMTSNKMRVLLDRNKG